MGLILAQKAIKFVLHELEAPQVVLQLAGEKPILIALSQHALFDFLLQMFCPFINRLELALDLVL